MHTIVLIRTIINIVLLRTKALDRDYLPRTLTGALSCAGDGRIAYFNVSSLHCTSVYWRSEVLAAPEASVRSAPVSPTDPSNSVSANAVSTPFCSYIDCSIH